MPLLSRADHRPPVRCLAAARRAVSAQGRLNSSGHRTQNRAALTRWQCSKVSGALLAFLSDRSQSRTRVAVSCLDGDLKCRSKLSQAAPNVAEVDGQAVGRFPVAGEFGQNLGNGFLDRSFRIAEKVG